VTDAMPHGFLDALPAPHREQLMLLAREVSFRAGSRIFDEDDAAEEFWLLRSGTVILDAQVPGRGSAVLETLGEGELLGWSWLFPPYRWHLGATARSDVTACAFDARRVRAAIEKDPSFGLAVTRCVAAVAIGRRLRACRVRLLDVYGPPGSTVPGHGEAEG